VASAGSAIAAGALEAVGRQLPPVAGGRERAGRPVADHLAVEGEDVRAWRAELAAGRRDLRAELDLKAPSGHLGVDVCDQARKVGIGRVVRGGELRCDGRAVLEREAQVGRVAPVRAGRAYALDEHQLKAGRVGKRPSGPAPPGDGALDLCLATRPTVLAAERSVGHGRVHREPAGKRLAVLGVPQVGPDGHLELAADLAVGEHNRRGIDVVRRCVERRRHGQRASDAAALAL
jgi:hypothetical protein